MTPEERVEAAWTLQEQILALHHRRLTDQARLAYMLARLRETRGYRDLGYASVAAFARARLGYSAGKTRDLLKLVERLEGLPRIAEAFAAGELPWTKARAVARVATSEDEDRWLEEARRSSRRQLEMKVAEALDEAPEIRLTLTLTPEEHLTLQEGVEALRSEGENPTLASALAELVRRALHGDSTGSSAYRVVLYHCEACESTARRGTEGDVPVGEEALDRVLCDAEIQDEETGHLRRTAPPAIARRVMARAGGSCQVPGCGNRSYLEIHHEGGWRTTGHDPERMLVLCSAHHAARHEGRLRIEGIASTGFRFSLSDGTPLEEDRDPLPGAPGAPGSREDVQSRSTPSRSTPSRSTPSRSTPSRSRERSEASTESESQELRDARTALRRLGFGKREVRRCLARVRESRPGLRHGSAEELVVAALAAATPPPRPATPSGAGSPEERARVDRRGRPLTG